MLTEIAVAGARQCTREPVVALEMRRQVERRERSFADDDAPVDNAPGDRRRRTEHERRNGIGERAGESRPSTCRRRRNRRPCPAPAHRCRRARARPLRPAWRSRALRAPSSPPAHARPAAAASPAAFRPIMCAPSFDAQPSTPSPTCTPASRIRRTGAMPDARRMFEHGQCATPVPVRAKSAMPASSSFTQCACQTSRPTHSSSSAYCAGVRPNFSRLHATSWSFSARCVCIGTPYARASAADSRIRSRLTENGEHGATPTRSIECLAGSWNASMTRRVSARIASSRSTSESGGSPPWLAPTLMLPRVA